MSLSRAVRCGVLTSNMQLEKTQLSRGAIVIRSWQHQVMFYLLVHGKVMAILRTTMQGLRLHSTWISC